MPRKLWKYVSEDRTDGVLRFYFRRKGQKKTRLLGLPGSEEFREAYYRALDGTLKEERVGPKIAMKGTFRWLCERYFVCSEYKRLAPRTQHVRKLIIEHMWFEPLKPGSKTYFEDMPIQKFDAKAVRTLRDRKSDTPEAANSRIKALRSIFGYATQADVNLASVNPARDVSLFPATSQGYHSWTTEDIAAFKERHPIGTKARLAFSLLYYTAQRRSDIVLFGRQHASNGELRFTQQKNRNRKPVTLILPIHPELQSIVNKSPCGDMTFLVTEFNRPFTANGFGNWFRDRCNEAGLPHCSAHGLRKAFAASLADNGATEHQIMAITGHKTSKEVTRYTKGAQQKVLARSGMLLMSLDIDPD